MYRILNIRGFPTPKHKKRKKQMNTWVVKVINYKNRYGITIPIEWKKKYINLSNTYLFLEENEDKSLTIFTEEQWYEKKVARDKVERLNKSGKPIKKQN